MRARDGGSAEQERDAGGDERAEGDEQDDQRQAVGDSRTSRVSFASCRDGLGGRHVAERLDAHVGVGLLRGRDGGERGVDALSRVLDLARQLVVHDDRAAVPRDRVRAVLGAERALDVGDVRRSSRRVTTSLTAAVTRGSSAFIEPLPWMRTCSPD